MGIEEQDDLLREALASYAGREPRRGIEERVLRRVRAPRLVRRSGWAVAWLAGCA
jgi:anti-sigma factor RsiW